MRIGVNTGEVLVGALRAGGDYTAMGDVVNTANRLQTAAQPGDVLVGPATLRRHAPRRRATTRSEPIDAKGREELGARVAGRRAPSRRPATGRSATGPASSGASPSSGCSATASRTPIRNARGSLLLLLGEAGVGKSRLAEELASHAECEHNALDPRGPLRALRRGQRVVAGRRRAAPRRAASARATPPRRPSR